VPDLRPRFDELLRRLGEISDVERAEFLLTWDQETGMPPLGAPARAEQLGTLARISHELGTAPELGSLLEDLRELEETSAYESFEASVIRVTRRDYEKKLRIPSELRAEMTRAASVGYAAWLRARDAVDYEILRPHLERRLALTREYVACFEPDDDPYDVLLDDHEPGMPTSEVAAIFERLKAELVPLIGGMGEPVDDACLHGYFSVERQRQFSLEVLTRWGMDGEAWRLDDTVHPFASNMSISDIRLTTQFHDDQLVGIRVVPGVRRVDADEVTYPLHIILRFELEREMLAGSVTPSDLPEAFDAKLREYLGVEPANVVDGVLQDVHWSDSSFGYFPTYALGNVVSVQLWERATSELGDLEDEFERGEFGSLREWLREHVHRWGRTFKPPELLERAVGGPLDAEPYLAYLRGKVEALDAA
jgi:Zn-dependent M32 family carboxypeptidase